MSELALYAFDKPLALSPNTRIRLRRVNPMFGDGTMQGTFSFPFQLPKKPNMELLGFSHDPQISNPITLISEGVRLAYAGESITGTLSINDAGSLFECQFLADTGDAARKLQSTKLQDLAFANAYQNITTGPGSSNRARNLAASVVEGGWPLHPYVVFPYYNSDYFRKNPRTGGYGVANNFLRVDLEPQGFHRPKLLLDAPQPILLIITDIIGEFIDGERVSNGSASGIAAPFVVNEPNRLLVLEPQGGSFSATTITGLTSGATAFVNTTSTNAPWPEGYWQCPAVFAFAVFEGIAQELGYEFVSELATDPEIIKLVLLTNRSINFEQADEYGVNENPLYYAVLPYGFYLKDFLPTMTVGEFLNEFKQFWGWVSFFDQQKQRFTLTPLKSLLNKAPDADWTAAASSFYNKELVNNYGKSLFLTQSIDPEDKLAPMKSILGKRVVDIAVTPPGGYRVGDVFNDFNGDWQEVVFNIVGTQREQFYSYDMGEASIGAGEPEVLQSKFGIPAMKNIVQIDADTGTRMPMLGSMGGMNGFDLDQTFSPICRILFWRDLMTASYQDEYLVPYASSDSLNPNLEDVYNYTVKFDGPKGRLNVWLAEYLDFMRNTFLVKRRINLPPGELLSFDITRKKVIEGTHYFIKHIDITLPYRQPAEAEMYKY